MTTHINSISNKIIYEMKMIDQWNDMMYLK